MPTEAPATKAITKADHYVTVPERPLTIEEGVALINDFKRKIDTIWQYLLYHHWNIGVVATHLSTIYGKGVLEEYGDEIDVSTTVIRECMAVVRWFRLAVNEWNRNNSNRSYDSAEAYFEEFVTTPDDRGKPIRWYHLQNLIKSNVRPGVLNAEELTRRLIAMMEANNRALERINDAARTLPPDKRKDVLDQAAGVEVAYTDEAAEFVRNGHRVLDGITDDSPEVRGAAHVTPTNGKARKTPYKLHRRDQTPNEGEDIGEYPNALQAMSEALKRLGYHVTPGT